MAKAYWIAHVDVSDPEAYENYRTAAAPALKKFGARFLVRGGPQEQAEGQTKPRTVVIEFDNLETAKSCYQSEEYQAARAIRATVATSDLVIIEGYDLT